LFRSVGQFQMVPAGNIVAGPESGVALPAGKVGARQQKRPFVGIMLFKALQRGPGHLHTVDIVRLFMAAGLPLIMVTNIFGHGLAFYLKDRWFIHVVPDTGHLFVCDVILIFFSPSILYFMSDIVLIFVMC